jgi:YHS domain-containing protein
MKTKLLIMLATVAGLAAVITLVGCKKKEQPAAPLKTQTMEEMTKKAATTAEEMKKTVTATAEEAKKTAETMAASMEQTMCPVTGDKIDKNVFVEYQGKKVYFCCADCKAKFEAEPEKYLSKLPQFKK